MEPQYAFSIPSVEDDTALDCRVYHPKSPVTASAIVKGAIVAHPYAPLGGCYDDNVVLALVETLLERGYVVGTFNFRGAGESAGRTTWTGKGELQDYVSFTGFLIYYLQHLSSAAQSEYSSTTRRGVLEKKASEHAGAGHISLLLAGYSYGSLILARFPPTTEIITRFQTAQLGTAAAEIILRARTLAKQTRQALEEQPSPTTLRGRQLHPGASPTSPSKRASPMTVGGEETDPANRRRSRDSRRSVDVVRKSVEMPKRIKAHIKHRRGSNERPDTSKEDETSSKVQTAQPGAPVADTSYLFVSPVLLPFSSSLLPPGASTAGKGDSVSGRQYLKQPTLVVFGSSDSFTSSKRLMHWAQAQAKESQSDFRWHEVDAAGHFWGEPGVLKALQQQVTEWSRSVVNQT